MDPQQQQVPERKLKIEVVQGWIVVNTEAVGEMDPYVTIRY